MTTDLRFFFIDRNAVWSSMCRCQKIEQIAWSHGPFRWGRPTTLGLSRPSSNTLSHAGNKYKQRFISSRKLWELARGTLYLFIQFPPIHFSFISIFIFFPLPFILSPGASFHDFSSSLFTLRIVSSLSTAKNGAVFYTDTRTDKQAHTNNSRSNMSILLFFLLASVITFKTLWLCALRSFSLGRRRLCGGCKREDYPIRVKRCGFCSFYQLLLWGLERLYTF